MGKLSLLSVDDDENLQTVVSHYLENEGYDVSCAHTGAAVREVLQTLSPNIILLDLVLPDTDGISLLGHIRSATKTPVIVVSGKSDTTEKIVCLEMGADDYMTKPFEMRELSARIKAVLRRAEVNKDPTQNHQQQSEGPMSFQFGQWLLDGARFQLFDKSGVAADLTTGEFKLLQVLVSSPNRVLTRERLFEMTRESDYDSFDRAVDIQIGRLRKKLGDDPKSPQYIKTVRGAGYMFCGDVVSVGSK